MKTSIIAISAGLIATSALTTTPAAAEDIRSPGRFGLGIGSGTLANGLSAKYFASKQHAFQFHLGPYGGGGFKNRWAHVDGLGLGADYLFEMPSIARVGKAFELGWNLGVGLGLGFRERDDELDGFALAAAFVAGLEFNFIPVPLDLVLEWRPSILVVPDVGVDLVDFTAQLRFYF
jgi:hypothetical protein